MKLILEAIDFKNGKIELKEEGYDTFYVMNYGILPMQRLED